jgi:8-oxo-dGTP pyrophosphatase MutT (NUDIX family)
MATHSRAHVFVYRGDTILVLQQASGTWWEQPGGDLLPDEEAEAAAVRETLEETGLTIQSPVLLREWAYRNRRDDEVRCFAYAAEAPSGEVVLSEEHAAFEWMAADAYAERYCNESVAALAPAWARAFLAEMRTNCALFEQWRRRRS